jgi:hypothetical protein
MKCRVCCQVLWKIMVSFWVCLKYKQLNYSPSYQVHTIKMLRWLKETEQQIFWFEGFGKIILTMLIQMDTKLYWNLELTHTRTKILLIKKPSNLNCLIVFGTFSFMKSRLHLFWANSEGSRRIKEDVLIFIDKGKVSSLNED